ncbi:MAG: ATP-dependent DNA helicase RecQ [Betaproteobacteria bacterium]|nr:MAG: ATP-dependent DNA helicase RecQ [Betaproteobacteria bacterium]
MKFDYAGLQATLAAWQGAEIPTEVVEDPIFERVRQILRVAKSATASTSWKGDLQPLIRQILLRQSSHGQQRSRLRVPSGAGWPTVSDWAAHSVSALSTAEGSLVLVGEPWLSTWLDSEDRGAFADTFTEKKIRPDARCPSDPFLVDSTGHSHYSCPGQREAIRAAFLMKRGHTLIVNLPTGSGKSLVGHAPALMLSQEGNLTIFVVPTVALAMDQERQMISYFRQSKTVSGTWPLAWHGGLATEARDEIRRRMRQGTQRIVFTSPEALTTSLLSTVFDVARAGMLRFLIIDEAHLVTQWGDEFRPAFQALAGLRNALLRHAPNDGFCTLLLSATFTSETVETLANLFGPPDRVEMVSAVHLRPEPQYWFHRAASTDEKEARILEALRHAPRPFILYVTTRSDAHKWLWLLRTRAGLTRIECFEGNTPDDKRADIIRKWAGNELDGVVATSAFGVGIDKSDVRTVIHAAIPETLDRFYQEVGRGGRDGHASISLLVYDDRDWAMPESLAKPKLISDELGFERWKALYASRTEEENGLIRIDLEAVPNYLRESNDYSVGWNMRTLLLMCRAGLIELDVEPNVADRSIELDEFSASSPLAAMATVRIRILNNGHQLDDVWESAIAPIRGSTQETAQRSLSLMKRLLRDNGEVAATLAELYRISSERWPVHVTRVCGGCPVDRVRAQNQIDYRVPIAVPIYQTRPDDFSEWNTYFPWLDPELALVFYDDKASAVTVQRAVIRFVGWLVQNCALQEVAADRDSAIARTTGWRELYRRARDGVVVHRDFEQFDEEPYSPLARVTILEGHVPRQTMDKVWELRRPHHIVLLPKGMQDSVNPKRLIRDIAGNSATLEHLLQVLSQ